MGGGSEVDDAAEASDRSEASSVSTVGRKWSASTVAWGGLGLVLALLGVTVAVASFVIWTEYTPTAARAMCGRDLDRVCDPASGAVRAVDAWWIATSITGTLGTGLLLWAIVRAVRIRGDRRLVRRSAGAAVAALGGVGATVVSGAMAGVLAWDQLALMVVTDAAEFGHFRGLGWLFDSRADMVRFVLSGGTEVGVGTMRSHVIVTVATTVAAFGLLAVALWLLRPGRPASAEA